MTSLELGFWSIGAVLLLIAARIPIGVVLGGVSILGIAQLRGLDVALGLIKSTPFEFSAHWSLSAIPMFLLMGSIAHHSGISQSLFRAARLWFSGLPGGLAVATNLACAAFAAASGSVVAHSVITSYLLRDEAVLNNARKAGVTLYPGGKEFDALVAQREKDQRKQNIDNARKFGVKNPESIALAFEKALAKWRGLSKEIGRDVGKYEAVLKREIYDKLDLDKL